MFTQSVYNADNAEYRVSMLMGTVYVAGYNILTNVVFVVYIADLTMYPGTGLCRGKFGLVNKKRQQRLCVAIKHRSLDSRNPYITTNTHVAARLYRTGRVRARHVYH